jgi:hypothetical protein
MDSICNEEEAIKITIEHGHDGAEFQTSVWKNRGCLKPNRTLEALISKLKTIYNSVEVNGNGKKRRYTLTDKKDQVSKREFNYKGSIATPEDNVMKEYIFNRLLKNRGEYTQSYKHWAKLMNFPDTTLLSISELTKTIKDLHYGFPTIYNPKEVVSHFIQTMNTRNKDVIEKSFKRLENEGRIKCEFVYNFTMVDGKYREVHQIEYELAQAYLKEFLSIKDITYYSYIQSVTGLHQSSKMKRIIREVEEFLADHLNIKYFFKSVKVEVIDKTVKRECKTEEFNQAYYQRLIKLTKERQEKENYQTSLSFWRRFYLINTLTLLDYLKVNGVSEMIKEEKKLMIDRIDNFSIDLMIYQDELKKKREKIHHTFGKVE